MFFPKNIPSHSSPQSRQPVSLKASHIYLDADIVQKLFAGEVHVYVAYDPAKSLLLITPIDNQIFLALYKPVQVLLKDRNLKGDKTIALHEILIDHKLDDQDRALEYACDVDKRVLRISM